MQRQNFYDYEFVQLETLLKGWGLPAYRARQVWNSVYDSKADNFDAMHNLPRSLRSRLDEIVSIHGLTLTSELCSQDGDTRKYLFRLPDGQLIETVLMEYSGIRRTACISTQAGCAMGCVFCATGQMGFARNLTVGEIVEQAMYVARTLEASQERLSNIVLMGMGEPFHNYDNVLAAIYRLSDPNALGIGQRHITVSTVGLVPAIKRFADEGLQVRLAISLHAATDKERSALLPVNRRYPIRMILDAVKEYIGKTGRRVTFEWALIDHQNDTDAQAHSLGRLLAGLLCHVNVIPLNPTVDYGGKPSNPERAKKFVHILQTYGISTTIRIRRGIDINAGCGQLKTDVIRQTERHAVNQLTF